MPSSIPSRLTSKAGDGAGVLCRLPLAVAEVGGDGDHSLGDRLAQVVFGSVLEPAENHGADLLWGELVVLAEVGDADEGLVVRARGDSERPGGNVLLHGWVAEGPADQTLGIKDAVLGVHRHLHYD
eukprot:scaffold175495_cov37-Prasinocladus_malaysianus.AAC.2